MINGIIIAALLTSTSAANTTMEVLPTIHPEMVKTVGLPNIKFSNTNAQVAGLPNIKFSNTNTQVAGLPNIKFSNTNT
ncbi:hypothetical protein Q4601_18315, partial [Shewanella sp. 1_MG-2023]|nr:hypothetical protein [Shewanella sp. 1_MG-2023]